MYRIRATMDSSSEFTLQMTFYNVKRLKGWGYKLIKYDFSTFDIFQRWGFESDVMETEINFHDRTKITEKIIKNFHSTIRKAAGDDVIVLGCNTITHLSAGFFEVQRTGDDTDGLVRERTKEYGINTLTFRMVQYNKFYYADADCIGVTKNIPWKINRKWMDVVAKSGTPLFVSIADDAFDEETRKLL